MRFISIALVVYALASSQASGLRIVVINGEDTVNVIQQKTRWRQ